MRLGVLQLASGADVASNLATIDALLKANSPQPGDLLLVPENAPLMATPQAYQQIAEPLGEGPIQSQFSRWAKAYACHLVVGSMPIKSEEAQRCYTTSIAFGPTGERLAHYHKLHLFDVDVDDGVGRYRESDSFVAGSELASFRCDQAQVGMAICFDLRFAYQFGLLRHQGCDILLLPAAFTAHTGAAHWEPLLRARAIENQCYVMAAGQGGQHGPDRHTWGHSCIIDPWGTVLAEQKTGAGIVYAPFDAQHLASIRAKMPMSVHPQLQMSWSK